MQQLQITFKTPASVDFLLIDDYVDIVALHRAYAILIARQGLLRSLAVKEQDTYYWQEHAFDAAAVPGIAIADLSAYGCSLSAFRDLATEIVTCVYERDTLLYQLILLRRNHRENYLVMVFSHVIFDRVTSEVIKSQLMDIYHDLLQNVPPRNEQIPSFEEYTRQVLKGPQRLTEQELLEIFRLETFFSSKQEVRRIMDGRQSDSSTSFTITVPLPAIRREDTFEVALAVYAGAMADFLGTPHIPLLFVCDGRQYEDQLYYNTIGEFTDMVPLVVDTRHTPAAMVADVAHRLACLKKNNVNFLNLLLNPDIAASWQHTRQLMDAGAGFEHFDLLMFNFLGNKPGDSYTQTADVVKTEANPLPIHTLFNCIVSAAGDRLIFLIRCSYTTDIAVLRETFLRVAKQLYV